MIDAMRPNTSTAVDGGPPLPAGSAAESRPQQPLTETDAIEIWIGRWLRIRHKDLVRRYACDPRRLYEIWWEERFPGSRAKAESAFRERYPGLVDRTAFGYRRIPRVAAPAPGVQAGLFD